MGTEQEKGALSDLKGTVKEGIGKATDDERLEAEGKTQQAQGDAQRKVGDLQDTLRGDRDDRSDR